MAMTAVKIEILLQADEDGVPSIAHNAHKKMIQPIKQVPQIKKLIFITVHLLYVSHNL